VTTELLLSIARTIDKSFDGKVHLLKSEQGFEAPAFFIKENRQEYEQIATFQKKQSTHHIVIRYHAKKESDNLECQKIGDKLKQLLELLDFKNTRIRANNMYFEVQAGTLHFFVSYELQFYLQVIKDKLENIKIQEGVK